jgi:hypothetical protein
MHRAKVVDHLAAEQVEGERRQEHGERGDDRPRQRLVHRGVHHVLVAQLVELLRALADAVEDHDRVVDRVAGERQERRDDGQRDLAVEEADDAERREHVVEERDHAPTANLNS